MIHYVVGNWDMIIWRWFFFSFVSLFFSSSSSPSSSSFSPNCWHNTTRRIPTGRAHTHIHSEHWLCFLPLSSTSTFASTTHCQSLECATMFPPDHKASTLGILRPVRFDIACECIYDVRRMHLLEMNDYLIRCPRGYSHSCHHTHPCVFIETFHWRITKVRTFNSTRTNPTVPCT